MKQILLLSLFLSATSVGCRSTNTTLRFTDNQHAVAVSNPEKTKPGDKLTALIGMRKKLFFYVPRDGAVAIFHDSVDPEPGKKKLVAKLTGRNGVLQVFVLQLAHPLAISGPPTVANKDTIVREPLIANVLGGAETEIVGVGRGSLIGTSGETSKRLFIRPIDTDLIVIVETDGLDLARAKDFILRMGSLTFDRGR